MHYDNVTVPEGGAPITVNQDNTVDVPDCPIVPFIEGDGIGVDVTPVMRKVVDAAVSQAYGEERKIAWMEIYAGENATRVYGSGLVVPVTCGIGGVGIFPVVVALFATGTFHTVGILAFVSLIVGSPRGACRRGVRLESLSQMFVERLPRRLFLE